MVIHYIMIDIAEIFIYLSYICHISDRDISVIIENNNLKFMHNLLHIPVDLEKTTTVFPLFQTAKVKIDVEKSIVIITVKNTAILRLTNKTFHVIFFRFTYKILHEYLFFRK